MIKVFGLDQCQEWDSIVRSFNDYDVYYLSGYAKAFKLHGDGEPILIYYYSDSSRGINVVMKRDVAHDRRFEDKLREGEYFDLATPYGYGGWLLEGDHKRNSLIWEEFDSWCQCNKIISEFIRFHPVLDNAFSINDTPYELAFVGNTIAIRLDDEDAIWERFSSKNRSHIRVAQKEGVTVKMETSKEAFDVFQRIYLATMDHDSAASYYYFDKVFFDSIRNDLAGCYMLFSAYLGEKPIASSIMLFSNHYMNYHLSGQLFQYRRYAGTNLILYEAAKWGLKHGYSWLHLGGGLGAKEGTLYEFKKSFYKKGEDKQFFVGKKIVNTEKYDYLVSLSGNVSLEGYFPQYRA